MKRIAVLSMLLMLAGQVWAHKPSDSYLHIELHEQQLSGRWDIALRDLDYAIGVDRNDDANITWGELKARRSAIEAYAFSRLQLTRGDASCVITPRDLLVDRHSDGAYAVILFDAGCRSSAATLSVDYNLLFDIDPQHKGLLNLAQGTQRTTLILERGKTRQTANLANSAPWTEFGRFIYQGAWHIWLGFDHVLFLLALLLPSVLRRENGTWLPATSRRNVLVDVLKIVTAFTLAHSLTLALAALNIVNVPTRLVEAAIAASVILAALNNIFPLLTRHRTQIAFLFGLLHGFGFASVLADLGLAQTNLVRSLLGFNLGVELGQLLIVATLLPMAYYLRHQAFYRRAVLKAGSLAITVVATVWFGQRAFGIGAGF